MEHTYTYEVLVSNNSHYQDEKDDFSHGIFIRYEDALKKCKELIDAFLMTAHYEGMSEEELFGHYIAWGEEPYLRSEDPSFTQFIAWKYTKERTAQLCQKGE